MKNQTLLIEQMQHLQKIGVDTSNASMVLIATDNDGCILDWGEALEYVNSKEQEVYFSLFDAETGDYDHSCRENCGVFTLQDVLDKMPYKIDVYEMNISFNGKWIIRYKHPKDNISLHFVMNKSLIQAAYEILCWYMGKEYLKLIKSYVVNES